VSALLADTWSREDPYRSLDAPAGVLGDEIDRGLDSALLGALVVQSGSVRAAAFVHGQQRPTLTWLTVAPEPRERGLATALLAFLSSAPQARGVRELASAVSAAYPASLRWHLTRGFVRAGDPLRDARRPVS
jgi:ribosomal protein S18 acetylase RimI-like enzyme